MPVEHQPRANLIVGKQRVNKINLNSKAINKGKTTKNKKPKANNHTGTMGRLGTGPSFVLIKRPRLGRQLSMAITGKTVSMGNSSTAEVLGIGSVDLKFPSWRILSLKGVNHVPTVRRNIISGSSPTNLRVTKVFVGRGFEYGLPYSEQSPSETQYEYSFRIVESSSLTHEESDIPRRSKRARVVKDFGSDFVTYNIEDDPVTFKDAMASLEAKQWKEAVKSEMDSIVSNRFLGEFLGNKGWTTFYLKHIIAKP
ncbi:hypothetical protein Sango_2905800 [Sesamum angolense]|uniref:Retrovirus-related Pol polyprotein from transposon TNT 1-94-like beta-barrel domain-containing protein n=1 Tax=Sesamum angolense TaxID=2727404 RepID=A0AAE1T5R0_9LAMI|nr:hypothetical protein Sango_2905800 [Sesamum angolense]